MAASSRRSFLAASAGLGATLAGGMSMMATPAEAASPALLTAIHEHRSAYAAWMAVVDGRRDLDEEHFAEHSAASAAGASREDLRVLLRKHKADPREVAIDAEETEAIRREADAMGAIIDTPVHSTADLRTKLDYMLTMPDGDVSFIAVDDRMTRLMRSVQFGGGA